MISQKGINNTSADIRAIIEKAEKWAIQNLSDIQYLKNENYQKLLILSTIDAFAQMWGNYPPACKTNSNFCSFVLKYSSQSDLLKQTCPVTLYYNLKRQIWLLKKKPSTEEVKPPKKEITLQLEAGRIYRWDNPVLEKEANRIFQRLRNEFSDKDTPRRTKNKHTYVRLLYQLRNKIAHEMNDVGAKFEFCQSVPSIASWHDECGKTFWSLNFPRLWLYNLAEETIINFLDDCLKAEEPLLFLYNERTIDLAWYD